jgi:hypothetical protein
MAFLTIACFMVTLEIFETGFYNPLILADSGKSKYVSKRTTFEPIPNSPNPKPLMERPRAGMRGLVHERCSG